MSEYIVDFEVYNPRASQDHRGIMDKIPLEDISEAVGKAIGELSSGIIKHTNEVSEQCNPDKIELEFSVAVTNKTTIMILQGGVDASIKVKVTWELKHA